MTRRGIDVSSHQHPGGALIDWRAARASGVEWAAIKLTESTDYTNPYGARDIADAKAAGIEVIAYHFARPASSAPEVQARHFLDALYHAGGADGAALDVEDGAQLGWSRLAGWVNGYLFAGAAQLVYYDLSYRVNLRPSLNLSSVREWVAAPSMSSPPAGCSVWQDGQGAVAGVPGATDLDVVLYDRAGARQTAPGAPTPPAKSIPAPNPILHRGDRGDAVRRLQETLNSRGAHVAVDGVFGDGTRSAVIAFQRSHRLLADGWVGAATWNALTH